MIYEADEATHNTVNFLQSTQDIDKKFILNTLRPRQYGCHFPDDIFKCIISLNKKCVNFR